MHTASTPFHFFTLQYFHTFGECWKINTQRKFDDGIQSGPEGRGHAGNHADSFKKNEGSSVNSQDHFLSLCLDILLEDEAPSLSLL